MNKTIEYYNANANEYAKKTMHVDMHYAYERFLFNTCKGAEILDLGCGSGRDSLYFQNYGMKVHAMDASEQLAAEARKSTGIDVAVKDINDLDAIDMYDGIWACASLLHLTYQQIKNIFPRLLHALHKEGILYMSFRYGDFEGERDGRYYTDLNIEKACEIITSCKDALLLECWKSHDGMKRDIEWLNLIVRRVNTEQEM